MADNYGGKPNYNNTSGMKQTGTTNIFTIRS